MLKRWSRQEKIIAKKAFKLAQERRSQRLVDQIKAAHVSSLDEAWVLFEMLNETKKDMQVSFDYQNLHTQLDAIFPRLLYDGLLSISELAGLSSVRLESYQHALSLMLGKDPE